MRADLRFAELRGNVGSRLAKASQFDAIVLALVPLGRLGFKDVCGEILSTEMMLPMVGQGAIGVECRVDDEATQEALADIDDDAAHTAVLCERAYLRRLGGGCELPIGALAVIDGDEILLDALVAAYDGSTIVRRSRRAPIAQAARLGSELAEEVLSQGGSALLELVG